MRFGSKTAEEAEASAEPEGGFLLVNPPRAHRRCDKPGFTPWSDEKDKFGPGTIWQCGQCQKIYLVIGNDPVVEGFWTEISSRKARKLLKRHNHQLFR